MGMDVLTELVEVPDLTPIKYLFPDAPAAAFVRPTGPVDILIGQNYRTLQPSGVVSGRNLRLVDSLWLWQDRHWV